MTAARCINDTDGTRSCKKCARCGCSYYSPAVSELYELIDYLVAVREKYRAEGVKEYQLRYMSNDIDKAAGLLMKLKWVDEIQYGVTITLQPNKQHIPE